MLGRIIAAGFGLIEALYPRAFVDFWMAVASKDDEPVELKEWVYTVARLEGVVILLWAASRFRRKPAAG